MRKATNIVRIATTTTYKFYFIYYKVTEDVSPFQVIEAKTPQQVVEVEAEDVRKDARYGLNGTLLWITGLICHETGSSRTFAYIRHEQKGTISTIFSQNAWDEPFISAPRFLCTHCFLVPVHPLWHCPLVSQSQLLFVITSCGFLGL